MDFKISSKIWSTNLPSGEKTVLLALDHSGDSDGFSWQGYDKLADMTGISKDSKYLTRILNNLEQKGHLLIWRQHGHKGGRGYTHIYWPIIGRTDEEILEIVTRRFIATEDEARAIIGKSGPIYDELVKRGRVSGKILEESRAIKKGVPQYTYKDEKGVLDDPNSKEKVLPETPKQEPENKKGVPEAPRSKESSNPESKPIQESKRGTPLQKFEPLTQALADVCKINLQVIGRSTGKELSTTQATFSRMGVTPAQMLDFEEWRKAHHWSGKKGNDPPSLKQVGEFWGQYEDWVKRGRPDPTAHPPPSYEGRQNGHKETPLNAQAVAIGKAMLSKARPYTPKTEE